MDIHDWEGVSVSVLGGTPEERESMRHALSGHGIAVIQELKPRVLEPAGVVNELALWLTDHLAGDALSILVGMAVEHLRQTVKKGTAASLTEDSGRKASLPDLWELATSAELLDVSKDRDLRARVARDHGRLEFALRSIDDDRGAKITIWDPNGLPCCHSRRRPHRG
jgi:hypothetical protein